jgi:hypothetical protein
VDETARWLGVTKAAWGQVGLGAALLIGMVWMLRRWGREQAGWVLWATLVLLAFVMIPTRVHDRFILLVLPFLIAAAIAWKRLRLGMVFLLIAATGQVTWPQWLHASACDWEPFEKEQRQKYPHMLAAMPEAERARQPPLEEALRLAKDDYDRRNQAARPWEWTLTLLSLTGAVLTVAAVLRLRPEKAAAS